jgi:hypothetical protein
MCKCRFTPEQEANYGLVCVLLLLFGLCLGCGYAMGQFCSDLARGLTRL